MKTLKISKTTRSNFLTYLMVIVAFIVLQSLANAGAMSSALKGQLEEVDKKGAAKLVGKLIAERAAEKGVKTVVFDRGGYMYTGRVASVADGAREAGLEF